MTDTVTEAAWLAAAKAIKAKVPDGYGMTELEAATYARAALEAALPLLVAGERERCAKIAEALTAMPKTTAGSDPIGKLVCEGIRLRAGEDIASAIRADKGGL